MLESLGYAHDEVRGAVDRFRTYDQQLLLRAHAHYGDERKLIELAKQARAELESLFEQDASERQSA